MTTHRSQPDRSRRRSLCKTTMPPARRSLPGTLRSRHSGPSIRSSCPPDSPCTPRRRCSLGTGPPHSWRTWTRRSRRRTCQPSNLHIGSPPPKTHTAPLNTTRTRKRQWRQCCSKLSPQRSLCRLLQPQRLGTSPPHTAHTPLDPSKDCTGRSDMPNMRSPTEVSSNPQRTSPSPPSVPSMRSNYPRDTARMRSRLRPVGSIPPSTMSTPTPTPASTDPLSSSPMWLRDPTTHSSSQQDTPRTKSTLPLAAAFRLDKECRWCFRQPNRNQRRSYSRKRPS
jgi:hypothetical protein